MIDLMKVREKVSSFHVLVVDDEEELRESVIKFMKKIFKSVDGAENGEVALKMLKEDNSYDIVLTDIRMPKMSGWKLSQEIKNLDYKLFVAIMSGTPNIEEGDTNNYDIFLEKPVDIDNMRLMLDAIIKMKGL